MGHDTHNLIFAILCFARCGLRQRDLVSWFFLGSEIMDDADYIGTRMNTARRTAAGSATNAATLKPKGACWYCNQPLDNVRRFCNKTCADDYRTEEETFSDLTK